MSDTRAKQSSTSGRYASGRQKGPGKVKGLVLLSLAGAVFLGTLILCICLILRSGRTEPFFTEVPKVEPLDYQVNQVPIQPTTTAPDEDSPVNLTLQAPQSRYGSPIINILLMGVEEEKNDTLILCSVHLSEGTMSLLAIPRDTYVAGDYEVPKVKTVYSRFSGQRSVEAVMETVKGMFGFAPDYYFILDKAILSCMVELAGGVSFTIPEEPAYHRLKAGNHTFTSSDAFALFSFKESWEEAGTEPTKVQRDFLLKLFAQLLEDENKIADHCIAISQIAQTDLKTEELAYLAYLLADYDFDDAYSSPLPGKAKNIQGQAYYEVNPDKAVNTLNEYHNPLSKELSVYNVNFRQEQADSGEGEFSDFGHNTTTNATTKPTEDSTTEGTTESESSDETEPTEGEPTEGSTEPTPEPTESSTTAEPPADDEG